MIKERAISVWLRADLDLLLRRVARRNDRPLLKDAEPRTKLAELMTQRYPVYAEADITVDSADGPPEVTLERVVARSGRIFRPDRPGAPARRCVSRTDEQRLDCGVELGPRSYDILIGRGLIAEAGKHIAPVLKQRRVVIVTDAERRAPSSAKRSKRSLQRARTSAITAIVLPPGEQTKSFAGLADLVNRICWRRASSAAPCWSRSAAASSATSPASPPAILLRGIDFVQIPTTLLAQVDSSVGGKTGIDTPQGKNLVGAFHQPRLVLADLGALDTLPRREMLAGYAEVVKYGLIGDPAFFAWLESHGADLHRRRSTRRGATRDRSPAATPRRAIVAADEREQGGQRALLNLGHTFGHALEAECGYGERAAARRGGGDRHGAWPSIFRRASACAPLEDAARVQRHLASVGLPTSLDWIDGRDWSADRLIGHMGRDKKVKDGRIAFVLARGIGQAFFPAHAEHDAIAALLETAIAA